MFSLLECMLPPLRWRFKTPCPNFKIYPSPLSWRFPRASGSSSPPPDAVAAVTTQIYLLKLEIYILATTHVFSFGWSTCFQMRLKRYLPSTAQIRFHPIQFFVLPRMNRGEAGSYHIVDFHQGGLFWAPYKIIVKSISSYCQLHYIKFP